MANKSNRVRLRLEVLEDRSVPAAHGSLFGSASLSPVALGPAAQPAATDTTGVEANDGEQGTTGADTDNLQEGPGSQTESTGDTTDNTADTTTDNTTDNTAATAAAARTVVSVPTVLSHRGPLGHNAAPGHPHHHHRHR